MRKIHICILLIMGFVFLWLAGSQHDRLLDKREEYQLTLAEPLENTTPMVAFTTVALGGFRGIIADVLWIRSSRLQEEGKYFELVQLATWITSLEPRIPEVWAFHAWNLAYNISVLFEDAESRWRWVSNGVKLLRDEGLHHNPVSGKLHQELGWFFQHKIGGSSDQHHNYYKAQWAMEMEQLFAGSSPDYEALAQIPQSKAELFKMDGVEDLVAQFEAFGYDALDYREFIERPLSEEATVMAAAHPQAAVLRQYLRLQTMQKRYRLDVPIMQELDEVYGPFDWRLPQAHSAYWAYRGFKIAKNGRDDLRLTRMIYQSMADSYRRGKLLWKPEQGLFILEPNREILDKVIQSYEETIERFPDILSVRTAFRNFLIDAVMIEYETGSLKRSRALFERIRSEYPEGDVNSGFDAFVRMTYLQDDVTALSTEEAIARIEGALSQSYFWLMLGDEERAAGNEQFARLIYDGYMESRTSSEYAERTGLPEYAVLKARGKAIAEERFRPPVPPTK